MATIHRALRLQKTSHGLNQADRRKDHSWTAGPLLLRTEETMGEDRRLCLKSLDAILVPRCTAFATAVKTDTGHNKPMTLRSKLMRLRHGISELGQFFT